MLLSFLVLLLAYLNKGKSDLEIKDAGTGYINEGDIALIFYITLHNNDKLNLAVSVKMMQCCEKTDDPSLLEKDAACKTIHLIGGNMGMLNKGVTKNVTLIFPNLYIKNREGTCKVEVTYSSESLVRTLTREITFNTFKGNDMPVCSTVDMDCDKNCGPVDCVVKYSGIKSFFNTSSNLCQPVPICTCDPMKLMPELMYSIYINECSNLNDSITKSEVEMLEANMADYSDDDVPLFNNFVCHHGETDYKGSCICHQDWSTNLNCEEEYYPSLLQYHMCNIETSSWNKANKGKIKTTALIIAILAFAIASKIIIIMCVLSWCYSTCKRRRSPYNQDKICTNNLDSFDETMMLCDTVDIQDCVCEDLPRQNMPILQNQTFNTNYIPDPLGSSSAKLSSQENVQSSIIDLSQTTTSIPISFESGASEVTTTTSESYTEDDASDSELDFSDEGCPCERRAEAMKDILCTDDKKSDRSKKTDKSKTSQKSRHSERRDE